ncbi:ATP-dependent nuclease [Bacillus paranthracis]|uniref:ATP-dependent nuclease n=1 Tax=Bacillus paranthracis TaxID=2026186 RepID=UPI001582D9DE|nr:AAA family ATPase [Bacillus paranthracis]NUJ08828.1 AAA family ATPase [Bacillus paranthracis]
MKFTKVRIYNFRSFREEEIIDLEELTAIIGSNSSGKTTFLQALLKLFGETSREREILSSDFHVPNNPAQRTLDSKSLYIDVTIEFPDDITVPLFFHTLTFEENGKPYVRIRKKATWLNSNHPEGIIESKVYRINTSRDCISENDMEEISKEYLSFFKVIYVPALRNPNEQLKMISGTLLWRFINRINFQNGFKQNISKKIESINEIIDKEKGISQLKKIIRTEWKKYHNKSKYLNVDLTINPNNIEDILEKIEANFSPSEVGKNYTVDALGDGLRSMFYFSLVGSLLKIEEVALKETYGSQPRFDHEKTFKITPPVLTLVAVEEPENHVAPHLLGKIMNNLRSISRGKNAQVILSSHSESIIKKVDPVEIRHFRKSEEMGETTIKKIYLPDEKTDEYKYIKEAVKAYPEIYFSSLVILGEGESEEIIIPRILEKWKVDIHTYEISVVPLGGRHVNHFWKLLTRLEIPFITLLDLDMERNGGGWGRIKYVINQLLISKRVEEKDLFNLNPEQILDKIKLKNMHNWNLNEEDTNRIALNRWAELLEKHNVFFSAPLDIDFLMIEAFKDRYLKTLSKNEGPIININKTNYNIADLEKEGKVSSREYKNKITNGVKYTLKDETKTGECYKDSEKALMIWYNYFFLNRGKPTTHILALNNFKGEDYGEKLPGVFKRMKSVIKKEFKIKESE